jgi:transcriptional regulator GlxA family with amidase domain
MVAFPGVELLDVVGPLEIFSAASHLLREARGTDFTAYTHEIVAAQAGPLLTASGIRLVADRSLRQIRGQIDTLFIAGAPTAETVLQDRALTRWLSRIAPQVRRLCSVCTGSFLLAEAGLLDGKRATTHWAWGTEFTRRYPHVTLEIDPIFVRDGNVYTSAGVTTGMDLALALVEEDYGHDLASAVARLLVLFLRRPGGQSQFSTVLQAQATDHTPLRDLLVWITEHPQADLSVPSLAARVAMSPRNFARVFLREVGLTPGLFIEKMRVDVARRKLETTTLGLEQIADDSGFGCTESMRRAFLRTLHVSPPVYRSRFTKFATHDKHNNTSRTQIVWR